MDISEITPHLYVGSQPEPTDVQALSALNIGLIINMRAEARPHATFHQKPMSALWLRTFDHFLLPIAMRTFEQGVQAALAFIAQGRRVLVYCKRGRHRSVAMAAAIMIAQGYTAADAMRLVRDRRKPADPQLWYIRCQIEKFEKHWRRRNPTMPTPQPAPTPAQPGPPSPAGGVLSASAQRVQNALAALGFTLAVVELPQSTRTSAEAAAAVGTQVGQIVKSLVFRALETGQAVMVLASGSNRVDEAAVAALLGEPIGRADPEFVRARTGFAIGGVSPVGHLEPLPTFIDEDLLQYDTLWAAAGTPNAVFKLTPDDLQRLTGGIVVRVKILGTQ